MGELGTCPVANGPGPKQVKDYLTHGIDTSAGAVRTNANDYFVRPLRGTLAWTSSANDSKTAQAAIEIHLVAVEVNVALGSASHPGKAKGIVGMHQHHAMSREQIAQVGRLQKTELAG